MATLKLLISFFIISIVASFYAKIFPFIENKIVGLIVSEIKWVYLELKKNILR